MEEQTLLTLTADVVCAQVANNRVLAQDVPRLVQQVHSALVNLGEAAESAVEPKVPVVSARASVRPDAIACMACGKKQKLLKRHLLAAHEMSPEQYRTAYGLPASYPMVAANYSEQRRTLAKESGLGRKPGAKRRAAPKASEGESE